ncbi:phage tail length tape measure family protein [Methylocystis sp. MJC1]|uniref:phage tail length tape measure family protein n=1 Tax=Methylocystis sp. MJC1 TaxID=2654282 RepID=UPI0013EDA1B2|nr:phage tail length tape measure family protein [Methylocystis sp. MJC1]KAF2991160.1 hypothetical protein MJC1_01893 [Methylocystis sp. MJC1]MBU6525917.1 phage tail length tape measure family protein [Methylocystis sp. MJC1]UZX12383.1 phage tail length tape measure family protein [Methylocystis sp. MJC1]
MSSDSAVKVSFGADTTGLDSAVAVAKARLQQFNAEVRSLAKEAASAGATANDNLGGALKEAAAKAASAQREVNSLSASIKKMRSDADPMIASLSKWSAEVNSMTGRLDAWSASQKKTTGDIKDGKSALDEHAKSTSLNRMQQMELMHVTKALADELAAGQSPMRALAMEGGRIAEIFSMGNAGVGGTLTAIATSLRGLTPIVAAATAAFVGLNAVSAGKEAEHMASQFGLSGEGLNRLGAVASKSGVEVKDLAESLQEVSKKAREGDENILAAASALGVSADQLKSKDLAGLLRTLQVAYDQNGDSANRYAAFQKLLGKNFEELYPTMQQGVGFLDQLYAAADRSGSAISGSLKEAIAGTISITESASAAWGEFKQAVEGAILAVYERLKPAIDGAIQGLASLIQNLASSVEGFTNASREGGATSLVLDAVAAAAKGLVTALALVTAGFETMFAAAKAALSGIVDLAGGAISVVKELGRAIVTLGAEGDPGAAARKTLSNLKTDAVDFGATVKKIGEQTKATLQTVWGEGAKKPASATPGFGGRVTGDPEPEKKAHRSGAGDALAAARTEIDGEIAELRRGLEQKKSLYDEEAKLKLISEDKKLALTRAAIDEEYSAERGLLQKELALNNQKPQQIQAINNKIKALEEKHADDLEKIDRQSVEKMIQPWHQLVDQMASSFSGSVMELIDGTKKFSDVVRDMARTVVNHFIQMGVQVVADWAKSMLTRVILTQAGETTMTAATAAGAAARQGIDAGAAAAGLAAKALSIIKSIMASAAETFAGVFGFLAPVLGPAAAAPAGAAMATVAGMASVAAFDTGAYNLPSTQLALVHKNELIMPAGPASALRNMLESGGGSGGDNGGGGHTFNISPALHLNIQAMDGKSVHDTLMSNRGEVMKALGKMVRDGAHLGIGALNPR